jgi:ABC-type multidrug transport system fused ATPase/permease subunit
MLLLGLGVPLLAASLSRRAGVELLSRRASLQARLVDGIQGMPDLLVFGRGASFSQSLLDEGRIYAETQRNLAALSGLSSALVVLLVNLGMLMVLVLAIPLVETRQIPGVMLAVLILVASAGFESVMPLPLAAQMLSSDRQAAGRLFEIVDTQPAVVDIGEKRTENKEKRAENRELFSTLSSSALSSPDHLVTFDHLSFTYPGQPRPALQDINIQLNPGKHLAIVGPSGAGKSTLANLLLRFWDYSQGQIGLDGRDLHAYPQEQVRRLFSFISQRTYFFNVSIRENLLLARPEAGEQEIQNAAQRAQIHQFITGLKEDYRTIIGEHGYRLSTGERQRLAIARALLKNAPIFLLDEPTASLDPLTERRILDSLFALARNHSLLLITHRLVGLENMDEILVLDHGRIVERGTHAELLVRRGLYLRMWDLQNRILEEVRIEK